MADTGRINLVNQRAGSIFVSFSGPGTATWDESCITHSGIAVILAAGKTCSATVQSTNSGTRFCASPNGASNCDQAQDNHQTLIERAFHTVADCKWLNKGDNTCIWYDISLIPTNRTDAEWKKDQCGSVGGGASYNFPVQMSCSGQTTYTCQGPTDTTYGPQKYPKNCGNPDATCVGNTPNCVNAYFYPMFDLPENMYAPNSVCPGGLQ